MPPVITIPAEDRCRCGHARAYHDSCSLCYCPWFLDERLPASAAVMKEWKAAGRDRKLREEGR